MVKLRTLTNNYLDVEVWDIDPTLGRGPFVVVQAGCAPGDETAQERFFLLRRDGQWIDVAHYLIQSDPAVMDEAVFDSTAEVMGLLGKLGPRVRVVETDVSREQLETWYHAHPAISPGLPSLRQWVAGYRERKRAEGGE